MKKIKKPISILLTLIMILGVFTIIPVVTAGALDGIGYLDEDGEEQTANGVTAITSGSTALSAGWYAVTADTEISSRITCTGDVNLILCNGTTLTAHKGITVSGDDNSLTIYGQPELKNAETGKLIIDQVDQFNAGIGGEKFGSGNNITINGGTVTATGHFGGAGIGGGYGGSFENITINGGTVTATGGEFASAIGGGYNGSGTVTINGGKVTATGYEDAAGIGGGYNGSGTFTMNGGNITASSVGSGVMGAAGSSITLSWTKASDSITAADYYGTVTLVKDFCTDQAHLTAGVLSDNSLIANKSIFPVITYLDEDGAEQILTQCYTVVTSSTTALSSGWYAVTADTEISARLTCTGDVNLILCSDTTLTAHKGITVSGEDNSLTIYQQAEAENAETGKLIIDQVDDDNAGIGGGDGATGKNITINGVIVDVTGGYYGAGIGGGYNGHGENIIINNGTVTARGGNCGAGIGGGYYGHGENIVINNGAVTATGGDYAAGIGGGALGTCNNITVGGGTVSATGGRGDDFASGIGGINTNPGSISLSWKNGSDSITASSYRGTVTLQKDFYIGSTRIPAGVLTDNSDIANKTIIPPACEYLDEHGAVQIVRGFNEITSGSTALSAGWYAVTADTEINTRITCTGAVNLILCNDMTLTAPLGITVSGDNNSLTIYQQPEAENAETGELIIDQVDVNNAGIGGGDGATGNNITINGGIINVKGGNEAAGIGGGREGAGINITINGGNVTAEGGESGAGIGSGEKGVNNDHVNYNGPANSITINGGTVKVRGGYEAAGIGGGYCVFGGIITIKGGNVTADSYGIAGIGNGNDTRENERTSITFDWTEESKHTMSVYSKGYNNTFIKLNKPFTDENGTVYAAGEALDAIVAKKTLTPPFYKITWENYDGTVLKTDEDVYAGTLPIYDGATPVRQADDNHTYIFTGWTPEITEAVADATYTATFKKLDGVFFGHSLTLDGDIGINFYAALSDAQIERGTVVDFAWTVNGEEKTHSVTLTAADKTANGYKATCPVAVAEMTCDVNATLTVGGVEYDTDVYSVRQYADTILSDDYKTDYLANNHTEEEYNKLATLVKAMLIYGAKAQIWFDRNLDALADDGLEYTLTEVTPEMISPSARDMETGLSAYGLKYEGSTIVYLTKTSLRHYYTITDQAKFDVVKDSIMFDAEPADYHTKNGQIYFEVTDIGAADLDTPYPLQIGTNIYSYTVLDYVRECLKAKYTPHQTWVLVCATYWYSQAANAYFGR